MQENGNLNNDNLNNNENNNTFSNSIEDVKISKNNENKNQKTKKYKIFIIIGIFIFISILIFGFINFSFYNSIDNDFDIEDNEEESLILSKTDWQTPINNKGKKLNIRITKEGNLYVENKYYKNDNDEIKYSYICNSEFFCDGTLYSSLNYVLIKDFSTFILYDYKNNKIKYLSGYNSEFEKIDIESIELLYFKDKLYGYKMINKENKLAIYNLKLEKFVTEFEYENSFINGYSKPELLDGNLIIHCKNYEYMIDFNSGKEIVSFKVDDKNDDEQFELTAYYINDKVRYFKDYGFDEKYVEICDNKFNKIIDGRYFNYSFLENDNIVVSELSGVFKIYNKENQLIKTSKNYKNIISIDKNYITVIDKDDYLKIVDTEEKEIVNFIKITSQNNVHDYLSGWYKENKKEGIYIVVEDPTVTCNDLTEEKKEASECNEYNGRQFGYEYYYIPATGETGKIATFIGDYAKPVLYLYPTEDNTKVSVSFEKSKLLTTTYPKYKSSWEVIANKNGDLYDSNGKYYYGLYWEESGSSKVDFKEGFYVTKENAIEFLEEKLDVIGLNKREANEFIMYWLPILEKNKKSLVYFELTEQRQNFNKLNINPKPDSLLRMAIHVKKVDNKTNIKEQKLTHFERKGFTAVEWGGVIH